MILCDKHRTQCKVCKKTSDAHSSLTVTFISAYDYLNPAWEQWRNRQGGRVPPSETSDREIFADVSGKKGKRGEN